MAVGGASGAGSSGRGGAGNGPGGASSSRGGSGNGPSGAGNQSGNSSKGAATSSGPDDGSRGVSSSSGPAGTDASKGVADTESATESPQQDKSSVSKDATSTTEKDEAKAESFAESLMSAMMDESTPESVANSARDKANDLAEDAVENPNDPGLAERAADLAGEVEAATEQAQEAQAAQDDGKVGVGDLAQGATIADRAAGIFSAALDNSRFSLGAQALEMGVDTTGALAGGIQTGNDVATGASMTDVALGTFGSLTDGVDVAATINDLANNKGKIAGAIAKGARVMTPVGIAIEGGLQAAYAETPSQVLSGGLKATAGGVLLGGAATGPGALGTTVAAGGLYGTSLALDYTPLGGMVDNAYANYTAPSRPTSGGGW